MAGPWRYKGSELCSGAPGGGGGKGLGRRTLPGVASGTDWPCRCWGASRLHRQTPLCGPTRCSPPSCPVAQPAPAPKAAVAGAEVSQSGPAEPRPFRFRRGAHTPPSTDDKSLVTAAAALATELVLKSLELEFGPPGPPAETQPYPAWGPGEAPPPGGIRASPQPSATLISCCLTVGACGSRRWGAVGETKGGGCPLSPASVTA